GAHVDGRDAVGFDDRDPRPVVVPVRGQAALDGELDVAVGVLDVLGPQPALGLGRGGRRWAGSRDAHGGVAFSDGFGAFTPDSRPGRPPIRGVAPAGPGPKDPRVL